MTKWEELEHLMWELDFTVKCAAVGDATETDIHSVEDLITELLDEMGLTHTQAMEVLACEGEIYSQAPLNSKEMS